MPFIRLILLAGLIAASCHAWGQGEQPILDSTWVVQSCKSEPAQAGHHPDCEDPRKLLPGVTFFVAPEKPDDYWLNLELQRPRMKVAVPAGDLNKGTTPDGSPYVKFSFSDFTAEGKIVSKRMRIELVRSNGEDTGDGCMGKLEEQLGQDFSSSGKHAKQCREELLAYWSIKTERPVDGQKKAELTFETPGDGHGTSTPPD